MTPQEIQALINAKIAGQGSAVDVGGALPQILSGILELAQSGAGSATHVLEIVSVSEGSESEADALARLLLDGVTPTKGQIANIDISTCYVIAEGTKCAIVNLYSDDDTCILNGGFPDGTYAIISLRGDSSQITVSEV